MLIFFRSRCILGLKDALSLTGMHWADVGHDSQRRPGENFPGAHFHLIAEWQTSPRTDCGVEI